jgi:hypothetical protein
VLHDGYEAFFNREILKETSKKLRAQGGRDRSAEDAYSSAAPDPTFTFVEGPCRPTLDFVIAFWIMIAFCISKQIFTTNVF